MQAGDEIKVLYISYDGLLDPLGYSQVQAYLKALAGCGVKLTVISFEKKDKYFESIKRLEVEKSFGKLGIDWNPLIYHGRFSIVSTVCDIGTGVKRARKIIKKFGPQIIHARSYIAALIALFAKREEKFVFDMRGFWPDERVEGGAWKKSGAVYRVFKYLEKKYLKETDAVVVLTERAKAIVQDWLAGFNRSEVPVSVIPTCADTKIFRPQETSRDERNGLEIAYLGSLGTWYLIDEMLDFFRVLLKKYPGSRFRFITNSPAGMVDEAMLRRHFSESEKDAVEVIKVSYQAVPETLASADATIFFIMSSFSKKGSCATKFAESLACGKPVIINSGVGDHDSHVERSGAGVIVRDFSTDCYVEAAENLAALVVMPEITERCVKFVEREMSVNVGIERYFDLYRFLIDCNGERKA